MAEDDHSRVHALEAEIAQLKKERDDRAHADEIAALRAELAEVKQHAHKHSDEEFEDDDGSDTAPAPEDRKPASIDDARAAGGG